MNFLQRWYVRYSLAILGAFAGMVLRTALTAWVGPGLPTYITFYPIVMFCALALGTGPGLVTTLASALAVDLLVLAPQGSLTVDRLVDAVGLSIFCGMGVLMSLVAGLYQRARRRLADLVSERTRELNEALDGIRRGVELIDPARAEVIVREMQRLIRMRGTPAPAVAPPEGSMLWRLPGAAGIFAMLAGLLAIAGRVFNVEMLRSGLPGLPATGLDTAACLFVSGLTLLLNGRKPVRLFCAALICTVSIATLLVRGPGSAAGLFPPIAPAVQLHEWMTVSTGLSFLLTGAALLLLHARAVWGRIVAQVLSLITGVIGIVATTGYLFDDQTLYNFGGLPGLPLHAAVAFAVLGTGLIFVRKDGFGASLVGANIGAQFARRLLPVVLVVPLVLGWFLELGVAREFYDERFDSALFALAMMASLSALIWWTAGIFGRVEAGRRETETQLRNQAELMDQSSEAMIVRELGGAIVAWNRGATAMYGWSAAEAIGQHIHGLLRTGGLPPDFELQLEKAGRWEGELSHTTKDGRRRTVESRKTAIRAADGKMLILENNRDVTERRQAEEMERQLNAELARQADEMKAANEDLSRSRLAALNLMDDAVAARNREKQTSLELLRLNRTLKALSRTRQVRADAVDETSYLKAACRIVVEDCGYAMVWIGFAEQDTRKTIRPVAFEGFEDGYLETLQLTWADTERGRGPSGVCIRSGLPSQCRDMISDPKFAPWREQAVKRGYASSIALPLTVDGKVIGALTVYFREADYLTGEEENLLAELADDLASGITTIRWRVAKAAAEEALRRSEEQYRSLFSSMSEGFALHEIICDEAGVPCNYRFLDVNPAFETVTGIRRDEVIGRTVLDVLPGVEHIWIERYGRVALTGVPMHFDQRAEALDRDYHVYVYSPATGQFAVIIEDITQLKAAQASEKAAAARASAAQSAIETVNAMTEGVALLKLDGTIVSVNPSVESLTGLKNSQLAGQNIRNILGKYLENEDLKMAEIALDILRRGAVPEMGLMSMVSGAKKRLQIIPDISLIQSSDKAQATAVLTLRDVTRVMEATELFERIFDNTHILIAYLDTGLTFTRVNQAFADAEGMPVSHFVGRNYFDLYEHDSDREIFSNVLSSGESYEAHERSMPRPDQKDAGPAYWDWSLQPLKDVRGRVEGLLLCMLDVTERKISQDRDRVVGQMLELFLKKTGRQEYLEAVVHLIRDWSGYQCAGVRTLEDDGHIPYGAHVGFSEEFWRKENQLSVHTDNCTCVRILSGRTESQDKPMISGHGSFVCCDMPAFVGGLTDEKARARYRGTCVHMGFASVAIIPICYREKTLGAIHLADTRSMPAAKHKVEFMETIAPLLGEAIHRFAVEEETQRYQIRLRRLTERLATAEEEERWRISRYIHDTIIQNLSLSSVRLGSMIGPLAASKLVEESEKIRKTRSLIDQAIDESRMVMADLTPALLYELGLVPALRDLAGRLEEKHGIRIVVEDDGLERPMSNPIRGLLFESVRELVMNALKHAGECEIVIAVAMGGDDVTIRVSDTGKGYDPAVTEKRPGSHGGFGLFNIRQRLEGFAGRLDIKSAPAAGTVASIVMPLQAQ